MRGIGRVFLCVLLILAVASLTAYHPSTALAAKPQKGEAAAKEKAQQHVAKANAAFDVNKMGDMSEFDPANVTQPTGETIKIGVVASFSGPAALNGQIYWAAVNWVAYDINKRGGIFVDGKKKLIEVIKGDSFGRADSCKKVAERMVLQEKVQILWGTDGSHLMKIINEVANKYKVIALNASCTSDDIQDATNFGRYSFQGSFSSDQVGRGLAYYYGQIHKKEKKFYILNQDYGFGHLLAASFKNGLKEYYPQGQIVGEDYHKLFLTDFAPYLTKIKASGAEVIFTGDWLPDAGNLLSQARAMGIRLPFANLYMDEPNSLHKVGVEGTNGLVHIDQYSVPTPFKNPEFVKFYKAWNNQWKNKWKTQPYDSRLFEHGTGNIGSWLMQTYWLMSVIERVKTTDPEKIIALWEGDTYRGVNGKVLKMRACDHKAVQDLAVEEYVVPDLQKASMTIPPYYWFKGQSTAGPMYRVPAEKVFPWMDPKQERCKGKNGWGE